MPPGALGAATLPDPIATILVGHWGRGHPGQAQHRGAAARRPGSSPLPSHTWSPQVCCPEPPRCQGTRTCCHEGVYGASARRCLLEIAGGGGRGGRRVPGARPRCELNQAPACHRGGWRPPAAAGWLGMSPGCAAVPRLLEQCGCCWKLVLTPGERRCWGCGGLGWLWCGAWGRRPLAFALPWGWCSSCPCAWARSKSCFRSHLAAPLGF